MVQWSTSLVVVTLLSAITLVGIMPNRASGQEREVLRGVDVSMLYELEHAGARYFSDAGATQPSDPIATLKSSGSDWFRLRLFVEPSTDYASTWGATQDLKQVRALAKRIKAVNGKILLDLHYSDTWADGVKQAKPKAWTDLDRESLEKKVYDYTRSVLNQLEEDGAMPDMVQIGNEIAGGMLFPEGQVLGVKPPDDALQWAHLSRLLNAGARAVRDVSTEEHKIRVMIHIHGGGHDGVPMWFFSRLAKNPVDFDIIGLSFYPAWGDSIERLRENLAKLAADFKQPVILAEVAYPAASIGEVKHADLLKWPLTDEGQAQFTRDVIDVVKSSSNGSGLFWWYPEAIPAGDRFIWRGGAEAFFDAAGRPRPAMAVFGQYGR